MTMTLLEKIATKKARIVVIGIGYVGLPLVVEIAHAGFRVTGYDKDPQKAKLIKKGESYIEDVKSEELAPLVKSGLLDATADEAVLDQADAVILCVPTPLKKSKDPDMSFIENAVATVKRHQHKDMLVVLESTTYPGTTRDVVAGELQQNGHVVGKDLFIAFSPERVDPGNVKFGTKNTPKVLGGMTSACFETAAALYRNFIETIVPVSSPEAAEMVKLLENTFRAVNIGLVNEVALICERLGLDVWEVITAASTKPMGFMPFYPGPGLGGHCIPIDPLYLSWKLRSLKTPARFIELADQVNSGMPEHVVMLCMEALNKRKKPISGSKGFLKRGALISYIDPHCPSFQEGDHTFESIGPDASFAAYDAIVIVTDHSGIDYARMLREADLVIDTRNATRPFAQGAKANIVRL
jgi:UDP-N-acetyl-D-glucosamine dehydrogenase